MSEEMKSCPFCGGEAEYELSEWNTSPREHDICCKNGCAGVSMASKQQAITAWNTRATNAPNPSPDNADALEALDVCDWLQYSCDEDDLHTAKFHDRINKLRALTSPQPSAPVVDVEKIKRDPSPTSREDAIENVGWNDCIDYLAAQGIINTEDKS